MMSPNDMGEPLGGVAVGVLGVRRGSLTAKEGQV